MAPAPAGLAAASGRGRTGKWGLLAQTENTTSRQKQFKFDEKEGEVGRKNERQQVKGVGAKEGIRKLEDKEKRRQTDLRLKVLGDEAECDGQIVERWLFQVFL